MQKGGKMAISEKKMQIIIDNYFKSECDINTSIRSAFEKGFRIGVKKALSAQPEPQWIPCSERLPKKSGQYYVSDGDKVWICEFLIIPNFIGGWCNDAANPVVQAWMPLPEPWSKNGKEST